MRRHIHSVWRELQSVGRAVARAYLCYDPNRANAVSHEASATFERMGAWTASARVTALDASTRHQAKRAVLDASVSILAGLSTPEGRAVLALVERAAKPGVCFVPGTDLQASCAYAAYGGSALCQVHDANDGHPNGQMLGSSYHPGRVIVPAAFALAQETGLSGREFLTAVAVGYDIATGVHHAPLNAPSDAYGSAASACYAFDLDPLQTRFALRIAGFGAPKSGAQDFETNNLTCAQQSRSGIEAAELVRLGYPRSEPRSIRTREFEFVPPARLGGSLHDLYFKPYPSCRTTHYFIEAALSLRPQVIDRLDSIKEIRLHVPASERDVAHKIGPREYFKSYQFSIAYCAVAALVDGTFGLRQVRADRTDDPIVQGLQERVSFVLHSEEPPTWGGLGGGAIEIEMADGTLYSDTVDIALGEAQNPLSDEALAMKLVDWLGGSPEDAALLLTAVTTLDESENIDRLLTCLRTLGQQLTLSPDY